MSADADMDSARKAVLAQLSPEEQAALAEDDLNEEDRAAVAKIAGEATGSDDDDEDRSDDAGAAAAGASESAAGADAGAVADDDEDPAPFKPQFKVDLPADLDDQIAALTAQETDLAKQMKDGDIELAEFLEKQKDISKQVAKLESKRDQAETFEEMNRQTAEQEWAWNIAKFKRQAKKADGIDYDADPDKFADFDGFVKAIASKKENADKDFQFFLTEAHKRVKALHGIAGKADPAPGDKPKPGKRTPPLEGLPKTLAQVPGGEGPGDVDGEFADLDKLDGMEYELALAKLSKEQRERYLQAA